MRLIINEDDFGITHACNLALMDCFKRGVMTSTSLMTNMPAAKEAAELAKEAPGMSVGLHFCLTAGKPLTHVPSLVKKDGSFDKGILTNQKQIDLNEVRQELQAQYDRYVQLMGHKPDHINSHHGIECIRGCAEILQQFSGKYDVPLREFLTEDKADQSFETAACRISSSGCEPEDMMRLFTADELASDGAFELAAHPGYVDRELLALSSLTTGRAYDAACFQSEALKEWIVQNKIQCITYKDLKRKVQL